MAVIAEGPHKAVTAETLRPYAGRVVYLESDTRKDGNYQTSIRVVANRHGDVMLNPVFSSEYLYITAGKRFVLLRGQRLMEGN